jgi:hypothetical protein
MKKLLVLVLAMVLASSAFAVVDPDTNMVGFYFDETADTVTADVASFASIPVYAIFTNPSFDALYGFEFGYAIDGIAMVTGTTYANPQALNVGQGNNYIVGFGAPTVCSEATLLLTMNIFNTDAAAGPIAFTMTASEPSSNELGLPTMLAADGLELPVGFSTIDGVHCAILNGGGEEVVATEPVSFDSVKSLYR